MGKKICCLCKKEINKCEIAFYHPQCLNLCSKKKYIKPKIEIETEEEPSKPIVIFSIDKKDTTIKI